MAPTNPSPQRPTPVLGDPLAHPKMPYPNPIESSNLVSAFLGGKGPLRLSEVPWPIERTTLRKILNARAETRAFTLAEASRLTGLTEIYLLAEFAEDVLKALNGRERSADDISISAWLIRAAARVSDAAFIERATPYYQELTAKPGADEAWRALLDAKEAIGPAAPSGPVASLLDRRSRTLLADTNNYDAQVTGRDLEAVKNNEIPQLAHFDKARVRVDRSETPERRLDALVDIYLERTNDGGLGFLIPWAVLEIRRHAEAHGRDTVIARFTAEIEKLRKARDDDPEAAFVSVRSIRAIDFFEAPLARRDLAFLVERGPEQMDLLSRSLMWPHEHDPHEESDHEDVG